MTVHNDQQRQGWKPSPLLSIIGILALIGLGLTLIFVLATAIALIIGYALLAGALVAIVYWVTSSWLKRRSRESGNASSS